MDSSGFVLSAAGFIFLLAAVRAIRTLPRVLRFFFCIAFCYLGAVAAMHFFIETFVTVFFLYLMTVAR